MRQKTKLTPTQKLDDALSDAETFIGSTMNELAETMGHLRIAQQQVRARRMQLGRILKRFP